MPSHKIHMYVEESINNKLNLDEDLFKIGNVLPDLVKGKHSVSHFKVSKSEYDFNSFIDKYKDELKKNNPLVMGYLVHLLVDDYYNRYIREKYFVYGEDNLPCGIEKNNKVIPMDRKEIFDLKHKDLENFDLYLLNNYKFKGFKKDNINIKLFDVDIEEIKEYIRKYNEDISKNDYKELDYFFLDREEQKVLLKDAILYIEDFLDKINLENKEKKYYTKLV
ncbi:MAG: hypothetical protein IKE73_01735 [Bacilli bacterium]|nr:hypothetical protein [Bacilli bacterium]